MTEEESRKEYKRQCIEDWKHIARDSSKFLDKDIENMINKEIIKDSVYKRN